MTKTVEYTGPCSWLVERRNPASGDPDWYPDLPSDLTVVVDCGAPSTGYTDGSFECEAGHSHGTLEDELGPGGFAWQREQAERYGGER